MLGKLELTNAEKKVLVMDDLDDDNGTSQSSPSIPKEWFVCFTSLYDTVPLLLCSKKLATGISDR